MLLAPTLALAALALGPQDAADGLPAPEPDRAPAQDGNDEALPPVLAESDPITPASPDGYELLDGVVLAVDDKYLTYGELREREIAISRVYAISTAQDLADLRRELVIDLSRNLLAQSGGVSLEIPVEQLEANLRFDERDRRDANGTVDYGATIRERGRDPLTEIRRRRDEIFGDIWIRRQQGVERYDRPMFDTYVRPGTLRAEYPRYARSAGASDFTLRQLTVLGSLVGGPDVARDVLDEARAAIAEGTADMAALADDNGMGNGGLRPPIRVDTGLDAPLQRFLASAEVGDLSPLLPVDARGGLLPPGRTAAGWTLVRVEGIDAGDAPPPFESREAQTAIRGAREDALREMRTAWAYERQGQRASIWIDPVVAPYWTAPAGRAGR